MLRPEHHLSSYDRQLTARRVVSDAGLIERGATVSAAGALVLGPCQLEYMYYHNESLRVDPILLINEAEPEAGPMETWLDTPVKEALAPQYESSRNIPQPLRNMSQSLRDVLVLGRKYMASSAVPNVGKKSIGIVDSLIADNEFGLEWKDQPTPEEVAHICQRLGQVTSKVLLLGRFPSLGYIPSVLEVVKMSPDERQDAWLDEQRSHHASLSGHFKDLLFNYPEVFATRFQEERRKIEYDHFA